MGDRIQGIFGKFKPVLDPTLTVTNDVMQGVFGKFQPVFDPASVVPAAGTNRLLLIHPPKFNGEL